MTDERFNYMETCEDSHLYTDMMDFIVNRWGINLCSVDDIIIEKQADGQLVNLEVKFIPFNGD